LVLGAVVPVSLVGSAAWAQATDPVQSSARRIWLNFFESRNALSLDVAASKEATLVQAEVAFGF